MARGTPIDDIDAKKAEILEFLNNADFATFTGACKRAGISRPLGYVWRSQDQQFDADVKQSLHLARESLCDLAENEAAKLVRSGNERMINLILKTIGKERGYVEKSEVDHGIRSSMSEEDREILERFLSGRKDG